MKTLLALFLFTISIFSLACPESAQLKNYNACVKIQWNYGPYINQYNEILVTLDAIDPTRPIQNDEIKIFHEKGQFTSKVKNITINLHSLKKIEKIIVDNVEVQFKTILNKKTTNTNESKYLYSFKVIEDKEINIKFYLK